MLLQKTLILVIIVIKLSNCYGHLTFFNIGGVLRSNQSISYFKETISVRFSIFFSKLFLIIFLAS